MPKPRDDRQQLRVVGSAAPMPELAAVYEGDVLACSRVESASRLLEADDVASYLGMRTDWVYREVRAGRLPHIRLGRAVRFRRESIDALPLPLLA